MCDIEEDSACGVKEEYNLKGKLLADAILFLWPGDLWEQRDKMNEFVQTVINVERKKTFLRPIAEVSEKEILTFLALIIAATQYNVHGKPLWEKDNKNRRAFTRAPDFGRYMNFTCFCEMKKLVPLMMVSDNYGSDPWWKH